MSDYEYDEPAGAGIDTGSLGRDDPYYYDPGGYDPNAIAQAAAESVHQAYYPVVTEQAQRIDQLEQIAASQLAQRDMAAEQQQRQADDQLAAQAIALTEQRLDASMKPGWFRANMQEIRREIDARPGLLPNAAMGNTPEQLADALEMTARKLHAEVVAQNDREQAARTAAEIGEMKAAWDRTHSMGVLKRELNRGR